MSDKYDVNVQQSVEFYANEGPVHRSYKSPSKLIAPGPGRDTLYKLTSLVFNNSSNDHLPSLGTRIQRNDGTWGGYQWKTYAQVKEYVYNFSSGLRKLGMEKGNHLGIYSKNRSEWVVSMFAAVSQSITIIPLYDTLGPDATNYVINHADLNYVVCSGENYEKILDFISECPRLKNIILMDEPSPVALERGKGLGVNIYSFLEVIDMGIHEPFEPNPPEPEDLFCIMYTSGTTGVPKGVMLTHRNVSSTITAFQHHEVILENTDTHISYLPLAHIMEMSCLVYLFSCAGRIGFWRGDITGLVEDIQALCPTIFVGAPRVFNRIYDKVMATISQSSFIKKTLFNYGYNSKKSNLELNGNDHAPFWNKILFSKIKDLLGGRVRLIISGSAPLAPNVQKFLKIAFCTDVLQGYGLTETCAVVCASDPKDWRVSHVGGPLVCNEVKLVDVPEMGYKSSTTPQRGEVCVRGYTIFKGYYKQPEKTAECLDSDGWFHTGDIGQWNEDGTLSIIDRKKNIFKLAQGEYVASEYIETVYLKSRFVGQIFVYGDSFKNYLVAILVPDVDVILPWAKSHGIQGNIEEICANERTKRAIFQDLEEIAVNSKLKGFEKIKNIYIEPEPWTTENGMLTPTMKMKRPDLKKRYEKVIEKLYAEPQMNKSKL